MCVLYGIRDLFKFFKGVGNSEINDFFFKYIILFGVGQSGFRQIYWENIVIIFEYEKKVVCIRLEMMNMKKVDRIERYLRGDFI